jgi:salicylate hydroxylase
VGSSRTILIAGAGIGGLTAALALVREGYRIIIVEQADSLGDAGAGIQLSPNATRILNALDVGPRLKKHAVVPDGLSVRQARSGSEIVFMTLGHGVQFRYGAPYWMLHRGDLQSALLDAVADQPDISLRLGTKFDDFAIHTHGVTAQLRSGSDVTEERVIGLVGADGLWSATRERLGDKTKPRFRDRTAWRAMVPVSMVPDQFRRPVTWLWLGQNAHLVHYPVRGGTLINIIAIMRDRWSEPGWSAPGARDELLQRFSKVEWAQEARDLIAMPESWSKWALFDRETAGFPGQGPVTLLGDAAHPMLPFLAQGAAMAIEDAAVLARCLSSSADDPQTAMRQYEAMRKNRVRRVQRAARANSRNYHLSGPSVIARNLAMRWLGGERLRARYDWIYDWRPD